ncbi:serine/threonine protein kinase, partial [Streptomyces sp. NPDC035033]
KPRPGRGRPARARPARPARLAGGLLLAAALSALALTQFLPKGDGGTGDGGRTGAGSTATPGGAPATAPATTAPSAPAASSHLTPAGVRTAVAAFRDATGVSTVKQLVVYEEYAVAEIPTKPGARTYDRYIYRDGEVSRQGVGGTISSSDPDEQPFDPARMPWDDLPELAKRADRELRVESPTSRYLIAERWTFNKDRPTLLVYRTDDYSATGYLAVDADGTVVHKETAD